MVADVAAVLAEVPDPELPFLSVVDLGVVRGWDVEGDSVVVRVTPTYSGCPAMDTIREDVGNALRHSGFRNVRVETVLSPAWNTDDLSEHAKHALAEHGIAPPGPVLVPLRVPLTCPRCGSRDTEETSRFGATACKALWRCRSCREPFESFKPH